MIELLFLKEKISDKDYTDSIKGKAYKAFTLKNGKLYPPMVAHPGGGDTPIGVWLEAEAGEFIELDGYKRVVPSGTSRDRLLARINNLDNLDADARAKEVKGIKNATLAYRPGLHLGDIPRAPQFDKHASWEFIEELPEGGYFIWKLYE